MLFASRTACLLAGALAIAMPGAAQAQKFDCAHGPDTYRVRDVTPDDQLNVRAGPSAESRKVGSIVHNGQGIKCIGPCKGRWCRIDWYGVVGWVNMRYLGE